MADPLKPRVSRAWLASAGLLVIGLVGGVAFDPVPARPVVHRGGFRVLDGDFHVHTTFSDGSLTPLGVVRQAERRGLDVIALTEHNSALPGRIAREWARLRGGPIVLQGQEVTTKAFHLIAVGVHDTISPYQSARGVIADIHAQGGVAIAAHPVKHFWPALVPVRAELDGSEVMHPLAYSGGYGWRWADMLTFYEEASPPLAAIGSSDYHWGSILGLCRTLVFVREPANEASVLEALRERRTVVVDREGKLHGAPALVASVAAEPIAPRAADYRYEGEGAADRMLRTLGFLGFVGLIFFSRRQSIRE